MVREMRWSCYTWQTSSDQYGQSSDVIHSFGQWCVTDVEWERGTRYFNGVEVDAHLLNTQFYWSESTKVTVRVQDHQL